jgi:hypothetical protein
MCVRHTAPNPGPAPFPHGIQKTDGKWGDPVFPDDGIDRPKGRCNSVLVERTIEVLNRMREGGVFQSYAIGGGIAALFYIEPLPTFDMDAFVLLAHDPVPLVSLSPIYSWLEERGYKAQGEHVVIEGIPVHFIPAYNPLIVEAVREAADKRYGNSTARVLAPEYLMAIMIQSGRSRDRERLIRFMEEAEFSLDLLDRLLTEHGLKGAFENMRQSWHDH